eukprot:6176882-Pleurochrysis_carterae.AAC.6
MKHAVLRIEHAIVIKVSMRTLGSVQCATLPTTGCRRKNASERVCGQPWCAHIRCTHAMLARGPRTYKCFSAVHMRVLSRARFCLAVRASLLVTADRDGERTFSYVNTV